MFDRLAEERIREAIERGELDGLRGAGKPLVLDDDALVPPEQRAAYRVLRNAGFVPEELRTRAELRAVQATLDETRDVAERRRALRRLEALRIKLATRPGGERALMLEDRYREQVLRTLGAE